MSPPRSPSSGERAGAKSPKARSPKAKKSPKAEQSLVMQLLQQQQRHTTVLDRVKARTAGQALGAAAAVASPGPVGGPDVAADPAAHADTPDGANNIPGKPQHAHTCEQGSHMRLHRVYAGRCVDMC